MHVSEDELDRYLSGGMSEDDTAQFKAHLDECDTCTMRLAKSRVDIHQTPRASHERRREPRILTNDSASLHLLSPLMVEHLDVQVLDVSRNGLKIRTPRFLSSGAVVQMRLRDMVIRGEVRYCVQTDEGFYVGLFIQDCVERRRAERVAVDIPATVGDQPARIVDQSEEGMLIVAQRWIPEGTAVRITAQGKLILARVVYCNRDGDQFKIGVKIDHVVTL